jgi:hypothetical protein
MLLASDSATRGAVRGCSPTGLDQSPFAIGGPKPEVTFATLH